MLFEALPGERTRLIAHSVFANLAMPAIHVVVGIGSGNSGFDKLEEVTAGLKAMCQEAALILRV